MQLKVRPDEVKACVLVRIDESKELMAIDCGYRWSGESWAGLLRGCECGGMSAPVLTGGDAEKAAIAEIYNAEDQAARAIGAFGRQCAAGFPTAAAKITDDADVLSAFYDFPAEHWIHLRPTKPVESTFATVGLRTRVTGGAGSRSAALAMKCKLIESAQQRWRAVDAPHLVALVRAGARLERGILVQRPEAQVA